MTMQERLDDIVIRSGISETIVRQVLKASADSCVESIRSGETVIMPFICKMRPIMRRKVVGTGETKTVLDVRADPVAGFSKRLEDVESLKGTMEEEEDINIRRVQLDGLT